MHHYVFAAQSPQLKVAGLCPTEPAPTPGTKYSIIHGKRPLNLTHWPFKGSGHSRFSVQLLPPLTSHPVRSFFLLSFLFSYFCHILYSLPLLSLAFRPPPVRTHSYVKTSISTVEHRALSHVGAVPRGCAACQHRLFFHCFFFLKKRRRK